MDESARARPNDEFVTCPGHCCDSLPLNPSLEMIERFATHGWDQAGYVLDMLVPLATPSGSALKHYTCRFFDRDTRLCTAYESRPDMCRDYPNGKPCRWCDFDPNERKTGERKAGVPEALVEKADVPPPPPLG